MTRIPFSLLVDDGAPVNPMYWGDPAREHVQQVPAGFTADFADLCAAYGVKGKFTVLPMPCGLGRIDQKLSYVPAREVERFLDVVRRKIAGPFDISPEILTHARAYRLASGSYGHTMEDEWVARATTSELTDYIALALRILKRVGLPASGVTSPWQTGITNERRYVQGIAAAQWRVHRRKVTWYFLHMFCHGKARGPWVGRRDRRTGQTVISIPCTTDDPFWGTQTLSRSQARHAAAQGADAMLTRDGEAGRIRELTDQGCPVLLLTHWQSILSEGSAAGLRGLEEVFRRIQQVYGARAHWTTCSELARACARNAAPS